MDSIVDIARTSLCPRCAVPTFLSCDAVVAVNGPVSQQHSNKTQECARHVQSKLDEMAMSLAGYVVTI